MCKTVPLVNKLIFLCHLQNGDKVNNSRRNENVDSNNVPELRHIAACNIIYFLYLHIIKQQQQAAMYCMGLIFDLNITLDGL